ncbi:MAG: ATP-binding protein [Coriobacteriia bacterium]|nr:ATP-binding protein [Coriobacteriia bacterium]
MAQSGAKGIRLSRRIFLGVAGVTAAVLLVVAVVVAQVSFNTYESSASQELLVEASQAADLLDSLSADQRVKVASVQFSDLHVTLISQDGTVIFDSLSDSATMENHADRPEIVAARQSGEAVSARRSETLKTDVLYAAVKLSDGSFVRLGQTRYSLVSVAQNMALPLLALLALTMACLMAISRYLANRLLAPIDNIDIEHPLDSEVYVEMRPLLQRIDDQQKLLKAQNAELETAANMRRDFSSNVSHEMKTPLQVISGYAELMKNGLVPEADQVRFSGLIYDEAQNMRELINDVLTLSRLDESDPSEQDMPVDLVAVAADVRKRLRVIAEERQCMVEIGPMDACWVLGDQVQLEQVIYNLTNNALRYSPVGSTVQISFYQNYGGTLVRVIDHGTGVPEEEREKVFERFYRVDKSRNKETGGTGLGLAIAKHVVSSHNGSITIRETIGGGATFVVKFPSERTLLDGPAPTTV